MMVAAVILMASVTWYPAANWTEKADLPDDGAIMCLGEV